MNFVFDQRWKGCAVELRLRDRNPITGTVTMVGKNALTLRNIMIDGNRVAQARYEKHEIISVTVLIPDDMSPSTSSMSESSTRSSPAPLEQFTARDLPRQVPLRERTTQPKEVSEHLKYVNNCIDVNVLTNRVPLTASTPAPDGITNRKATSVPEFDADYIFLDRIDDGLMRAVKIVQGSSEIGLSLIGENVSSRHGTPSLFNIATEQYVFILDLLALGKAAFTTGEGCTLKEILESSDAIKVAHNCQGMADILHHLYGVTLSNVEDTLAFAASEYYIRRGSFPNYVFGLPGLLIRLLKLPESHVFHPRARTGMNDEAMWRLRPLPDHLLLNVCKTVVHLIALRNKLVALHMTRAREGSKILLNNMLSKDEDTAAMSHSDVNSLLPLGFLALDDLACKPRSERKFSGYMFN